MSEFLVVTSTFARQPLLAVPLVFGILVAFGALLLRLTGSRIRGADGQHGAGRGLVCADVCSSRLGSRGRPLSPAAPRDMVPERGAAAWVGTMNAKPEGAFSAGTPETRRAVGEGQRWMQQAWAAATDRLVSGEWVLFGLWGDADAVHMAVLDEQTRPSIFTLSCANGSFPSVGARHAPAIRLERAVSDLFGYRLWGPLIGAGGWTTVVGA